MPLYTFIDENGSEYDAIISIAERDAFLAENPNVKQKLCTPSFGDSYRLGVTKPAESFTDLMKQIKKNNHGSTIETK